MTRPLRRGPLSFRILPILVAIAVVTSLSLVVTAIYFPNDSEQYTELSILTPNESGDLVAADFPEHFEENESNPVVVNVENREKERSRYTLVVVEQRVTSIADEERIDNQLECKQYKIELRPGEAWSETYQYTPKNTGENIRVAFLLYRDNPPARPSLDSAYREVHFWTSVGNITVNTGERVSSKVVRPILVTGSQASVRLSPKESS